MSRLALPAAMVAALSSLGCGGEDSSDASRDREAREASPLSQVARRPVLCAALRARVTGRLTTPAATELSGLAVSRTQASVLWTHNDSGDPPRVFAVAASGRLLAEVAVSGAAHVDWEDIAIGPAPGAGDALYIGDIGDNEATRSAVVIYRVPEPRLAGGGPGATAQARRIVLRYPDGAHDAEALLVDPSSGTVVIVTKDYGGVARVYVAGRPSTDSATTMRRAGRVRLGVGDAVTAGDVSANGRTIVLRTYQRAFVWSRQPGTSIASAMRRRPCAARGDLLREGQGEALALSQDGRAFYTVPEGGRPALRRYAPPGRARR